MQLLTIKVDNDYVEKILNLLNELPNNKVEVVQTKSKQIDAFGILKNSNIDPVKWQNELREENDSNIYKKRAL